MAENDPLCSLTWIGAADNVCPSGKTTKTWVTKSSAHGRCGLSTGTGIKISQCCTCLSMCEDVRYYVGRTCKRMPVHTNACVQYKGSCLCVHTCALSVHACVKCTRMQQANIDAAYHVQAPALSSHGRGSHGAFGHLAGHTPRPLGSLVPGAVFSALHL